MPVLQDCRKDAEQRLRHSQQVMPSWECPVLTPPYLVLDKETVQYEMTLAGQTLAADLFEPLLRLAFFHHFYLTGNPSKFLYCLYSSIQVQPTCRNRWSSSCGSVSSLRCISGLVHVDVCVMKFGHVLYMTQDRMVSHLHTFQCRQGRHCLYIAIDDLLPSCYHNDVTVISMKSSVVETHGEVAVVKHHLHCGLQTPLVYNNQPQPTTTA